MLGIVETKPIKGQYGIMTAGLVLTIHQPQRMERVSPFSRRRVVESERQGAGSRQSEPDKTNSKMIENIKQTGRANGAIALLMILAVCPRAAGQADEPAARESVPRAPVAVHPDDKSSSADPRSWFDRWKHRGQTSGVTAGGPSHEANPAPLVVLPRSDQSAQRAQKVPQDGASNPAPSAPDVGSSTEPDLGVPANERGLGGGEATEAAAETTAEEPPATVTTLLMRALRMEDSPVKIYGWIENSFTGNANGTPANGQNFGVNPNNKANQWMGNQYYLVVENKLEQTDEINFGFRVDNMFGNDWQFNYMQGLFNRAFVPGHLGYDLSQLYGEVHLPILTPGGIDVKGGLWYSLVGYEQVPAIARPLLSVPYMFNYGYPFRHVGVVTTWHQTDRINFYNGTINGWDRWIDERYIWGYTGGLAWTSRDAKTSVAFTCVSGPNQFPRFLPANQPIYPTGYINIPGLAGQNNPGYARNARTLFTTVITHKWTNKLTQVIETDQGWELNVPGLASAGSNGATRTAEWFSFGDWFLYQIHPKLTGVWRSEVFWDPTGDRTGYADTYQEITLGMIYKPRDFIWIRPEARYDWVQFGTPYNDGTRSSQLTLAFDIIFLF
jgi:Putative beta-barrel porin-2, OmpL-like. bbp2